jgi:hypothetical protein
MSKDAVLEARGKVYDLELSQQLLAAKLTAHKTEGERLRALYDHAGNDLQRARVNAEELQRTAIEKEVAEQTRDATQASATVAK